ncbi:hypothetical protein V1478_012077, partial [Vespula squamosa]
NNEPQVRSVDKRSLLSLHQSEKIVIIILEKNEADWTESTPRGTPTIVEIHPMSENELIRKTRRSLSRGDRNVYKKKKEQRMLS